VKQPEEVFVHLLKRLSMPAPSWSGEADILADHEGLMQLIFSNSSFLERHWRKLVCGYMITTSRFLSDISPRAAYSCMTFEWAPWTRTWPSRQLAGRS